ncbi:hypothetical protein PR003_g29760 [Phytophthora rubi]|uniref:Retrotransposon gag domain-containing protein n=1 Tax=Phytophthora rubi TaxID=129364 RepID=A0A6A4BJD6_9STRA|nr:hypothetical protein PR002_g24716 [Phytophthora rubi]KAE9273929.1 hypothetical protein PR003_g29760 [Phytophthora rubi]
MSVPTFDGKDSDSLVFWVREIEIALSAGQIYDARAQVAFALSNLGGRARAWAMARETATPGYFTSWNRSYAPPSSSPMWHTATAPVSCGASKASGRSKTTSWSSTTSKPPWPAQPLSEDVKVTVFMDGVRTGPVRTELFRRQPKTFNEAVRIAMLEDHCVGLAQGHTPHVEATESENGDSQ